MSFNKENIEKSSKYYYNEIPENIERTFTEEQRTEIKKILSMIIIKPAKKAVDVRITFWFIKRFYLVILLGFEKRSNSRKINTPNNISKLLALLSKAIANLLVIIIMLLIIFTLLYIIKRLTGNGILPFDYLQNLFFK